MLRVTHTEPGRAEIGDLKGLPQIRAEESFPFVCAGCGDCCRCRTDLLLSGYDLYRLAQRMNLSPRIVAQAFCRQSVGVQTSLPTLCLTPRGKSRNCPFLEENACTVHGARPLACALYPLCQRLDTETGKAVYFVQTPLCGAALPPKERELHTLDEYLMHVGVTQRLGIDLRWAKCCEELSCRLRAARGKLHFDTAVQRTARALYFDYSLHEEFYPQFCENWEKLGSVLDRILDRD